MNGDVVLPVLLPLAGPGENDHLVSSAAKCAGQTEGVRSDAAESALRRIFVRDQSYSHLQLTHVPTNVQPAASRFDAAGERELSNPIDVGQL
jgi:hypothetical protein